MKYFKFVFLLLSFNLFSQNLVKNSSFENTKNCSEFMGGFNQKLENWSSPTFGTTDIFNNCVKGEVGVPYNYIGTQPPKDGNNYAGFYLHSDKNYREYVQVELSEKLTKGEKYNISFFVSLADKSDFAIKNIDFMLSEKELNTTISREISDKTLKKSKAKNYKIYNIQNNKFYKNKNAWTKISSEFIAQGNEQYLIIGNFYKNSKTEKLLVSNQNNYNASYYYIDLVHLHRADWIAQRKTNIVNLPKKNDKEISLNKNYIFQNVTFNYNSSELSEEAKIEIKSIYAFLKLNKDTKIIISGHTDNIGSSEFNKELSENRAKVVAEYFINAGLAEKRISSVGFGSEQPIVSNSTEKGRNQNRRVEFKIVKKN